MGYGFLGLIFKILNLDFVLYWNMRLIARLCFWLLRNEGKGNLVLNFRFLVSFLFGTQDEVSLSSAKINKNFGIFEESLGENQYNVMHGIEKCYCFIFFNLFYTNY